MSGLSTTRMSSKGQVVIPEAIRQEMGLEAGTQFVVVGGRDAIILKSISKPSSAEFGGLLKTARRQAKQAGTKKADVESSVRKVRREKSLEKWLAGFEKWVRSHQPIGHFVDDSRDSIYE